MVTMKTVFRLRGEVDGCAVVAALENGISVVGSRDDCDVVVSADGVSRRHAEIEVADSHLVIRDLESKNGVFVNASRVGEAVLQVGDRVRFGPALVILEEVDAEDVHMAISLDTEPVVVADPVGTGEMTLTVTRTGAQSCPVWAQAIHAVLDGLSGPMPDLKEAADRIRGFLQADGVCFVVWDGRSGPLVLATSGRLPAIEGDDEAVALFRRVAATGRAVCGSRVESDPGLILAVAGRTAAPATGTIVVGPDRNVDEVKPLIEVLTRLIVAAVDETPPCGPAVEAPALDFPAGFVVGRSPAIRGITVKALRALVDAPWPGNIRELENEVRRLVSLCPENQSIDSSLLSPEILYPDPELNLRDDTGDGELDLEKAFEEVERRLISQALVRTHGNRTKAAKLLGISRNGLALKITRLGLDEW